MRRNRSIWMVAAIVLVGLWVWTQQSDNGALQGPAGSHPANSYPASAYPAFLPREAHAVLEDIARDGPYEYRQDAGVFQNRERLLPTRPRGYYREFTVETPGSHDRGARRIVTGGGDPGARPPVEYFYTDDHYGSFRRFELSGAAQ